MGCIVIENLKLKMIDETNKVVSRLIYYLVTLMELHP